MEPTTTLCRVRLDLMSLSSSQSLGYFESLTFKKDSDLRLFYFSFSADVFEKALNAGFIQATDYVEIWQAYLDYLRRRVDFSRGESSHVCEHTNSFSPQKCSP